MSSQVKPIQIFWCGTMRECPCCRERGVEMWMLPLLATTQDAERHFWVCPHCHTIYCDETRKR